MDRGEGYKPKSGEEVSRPMGFIPEVEETLGYWDSTYGTMNDMVIF